jgi:putative ABC transport system permease protein
MQIIRLTFESFRFAWNALKGNLLRTVLSLLGVTIGIFSIIAVFTIVDSLEKSIRKSMSFIGDNVIYVQKWPWQFGGGSYPWWKYLNRPEATYAEFKFVSEKLKYPYEGVTIRSEYGNSTLKNGSNSISGVSLIGSTDTYTDVYETNLSEGRFFNSMESDAGRNLAIIGKSVAKTLFPEGNAIGKDFKIKGLKYVVIGVLKEEGENFLGGPSSDDQCIIPYNSFAKLYAVGAYRGLGSTIAIKGQESDRGLLELESELKGLMRNKRGLKPVQEDNFALNRTEAFADAVSSLFTVIGIAGWVIGGFSILVGGFGIANIMFVSVKERTSIIGLQKSLGAKNRFILSQFLFEAIFLSAIGGGVGIFLVFLISNISLGSLELGLSLGNIILGLTVSCIIGIIAGIAPALVASRMDPVEAIRS